MRRPDRDDPGIKAGAQDIAGEVGRRHGGEAAFQAGHGELDRKGGASGSTGRDPDLFAAGLFARMSRAGWFVSRRFLESGGVRPHLSPEIIDDGPPPCALGVPERPAVAGRKALHKQLGSPISFHFQ